MVHLSRKPYVHCSVPLAGINVLADRESIRLEAVILDIVKAWLCNLCEVYEGIVVSAVVHSPLLYCRLENDNIISILIDPMDLGLCRNL